MQTNEELSLVKMPDDVIFALDIGTRTIIGVVGIHKGNDFQILAAEKVVHESRAMVDGQIHDIDKVAQGAAKVVNALEKRLGYKLARVSIAAAGRVLKTCQIKAERVIEEEREIDAQLISAIEMDSIQKAQLEIEKEFSEGEKNQYYCVGYSVVGYYLNDYVISTLMGHKGHKAGVEVLATFLPQTVVDSLHSVMERIGLEVDFLTLEPIAALNITIPKELRLLNLALVDVGAGTTDIAITRGGTIVAYAMAPIAGDELTEAVAQNYLVDFDTAEHIKLSLASGQKEVPFTDILDNKLTAKAEDFKRVTKPVVDSLAKLTCERILELNGGKAPNAIFLIGGGSQSEGLCEAISDILELPLDRVAIRNRSIAKNVITNETILDGPDGITPLAILVTTALTKGQDFFYVTVNERKVRLYNCRKMLVSDALILAGFDPDQLICKTGKSLKVNVNGKERTIRGGQGKPAEIYVNDEMSSLNAYIKPADKLIVIPAENGKEGSALVKELADNKVEPVYLICNYNAETIGPRFYINDEEVSPDTPVSHGDNVEIVYEYTLQDIADMYKLEPSAWEFTINGAPANMATVVFPGEQIVGKSKKFSVPVKPEPSLDGFTELSYDIIESEPQTQKEDDSIMPIMRKPAQNLAQKGGICVIINEELVNLPPKQVDYLFIDLFNYIDFDLTSPKGMITLRLNGKDANYTDKIKAGDEIEIFWKG
ncbi:MAG: cell division protein FtsA [Clostridiaceae bacterium]|jgi:cell division protein FtsA|nr:cell division protein FtsA [Clostridiaceae bacterium]